VPLDNRNPVKGEQLKREKRSLVAPQQNNGMAGERRDCQ
jgi:hypothetical protein